MPYAEGLELQESLVRSRAAKHTGDWLLFPDHPPVLTLGRGGKTSSIRADSRTLGRLGIPVFEVARGGDVTWHGPGQLVGYAICDLDGWSRDLHRFLRGLEQGLIRALAHWGVAGGVVPGRTGVWVEDAKIASIGIAVRRWVSYHGFALNVAPDLAAFDLIHPCGLRDIRMTSMARLLGERCPAFATVRTTVAREVAAELGYHDVRWAEASEARRFGLPESDPGRSETRASAAALEAPSPAHVVNAGPPPLGSGA